MKNQSIIIQYHCFVFTRIIDNDILHWWTKPKATDKQHLCIKDFFQTHEMKLKCRYGYIYWEFSNLNPNKMIATMFFSFDSSEYWFMSIYWYYLDCYYLGHCSSLVTIRILLWPLICFSNNLIIKLKKYIKHSYMKQE